MKLPKQVKPVQRNAEHRVQTIGSIKPSFIRGYVRCDCPEDLVCKEENCIFDLSMGREHCYQNKCVKPPYMT